MQRLLPAPIHHGPASNTVHSRRRCEIVCAGSDPCKLLGYVCSQAGDA